MRIQREGFPQREVSHARRPAAGGGPRVKNLPNSPLETSNTCLINPFPSPPPLLMSRPKRGTIFSSGQKVERRLELKKLFSEIDIDHSGTISLAELTSVITSQPKLRDFFTHKNASGSTFDASDIFSAIDSNHDGTISWNEFQAHVTSLEAMPNNVVTHTEIDAFFVRDDKKQGNTNIRELAMEIDVGPSNAHSSFLSADDARVHLEPKNKLLINPTTDIIRAATEHCQKRNITQPELINLVIDEVGKGVEEASKNTAQHMNDSFHDMWGNMEGFAREISEMEPLLIESCAKPDHKNGESSVDDDCEYNEDEMHDIREFLRKFKKSKGIKVVSEQIVLKELEKIKNQKLNLEEKIKAEKIDYDEEDPADNDNDNDNANTEEAFADVDTDGDGKIDRKEWRSWADEQIKIADENNRQRMQIIEMNRRLRKALTSGVQSEEFREKEARENDAIMSALSEELALAQMQNSNLQAELHALEKLK